MLVARAHSRHAHFAAAVTARTLAGTVTQKIGARLEDRAPISHMREAWVRIPVAPTVAARILAGAVQQKKMPQGLEVGQLLHMQESCVRIRMVSPV